MVNFSERLKMLRREKNLRQSDMSDFLKCTKQHYQRIEYGKINLPTLDLIALADYFNVPLDYLVGRDVSPDGEPARFATPEERAILEKLRSLPPEKRKAVETLLD